MNAAAIATSRDRTGRTLLATAVTRWHISLSVTFLVALVIRLPYLATIPSLTDEAYEVLRGLQIARGELLPLTNVNAYLGSGYNYLLAAMFLLIGTDASVSRALVCAIGAAAAPATAVLARTLGGSERVAIIAGGLVATSGVHVLVSSHVAWGHSVTPTVTALAIAALVTAQRDATTFRWVLCGTLIGLMVQTHPTTVLFLPGAATYTLIANPAAIRTRATYLAGLAFVAVNANLVVFNLLSGGGSFAEAQVVSAAYTRTRLAGLELYLDNLGRLGIASVRLLGGAVDIRQDASAYLADPFPWVVLALLLLGGICRRVSLAALWILPYALLLPLANAKFEVIPNGRFLAPLLPLTATAIAYGIDETTRRLSGPWRRTAFAGLAAFIMVWPLRSLGDRYGQMEVSLDMSRQISTAMATIRSVRDTAEPVALDPDLDKLWLDGGGDLRAAFKLHLAAAGIPHAEFEFRRQAERGDLNSCLRNEVELRRVDPRTSPAATRFTPDDSQTPIDESLTPYLLIRTVQRSDRARDTQRGQTDEARWSLITYSPPLAASSRAVDRCAPGRLI
ncbi:MAG: glycosyltransferase family 39 protein [Chloroflexota bacterium]